MKSYEHIKCQRCDGHGIVASYDSDWFLSPDECRDCGGSGQVVRYESGVIASYPSGPLLGRMPRTDLALEMADADRRRAQTRVRT